MKPFYVSRSRSVEGASTDGFVSISEYEDISTHPQTFPMWLLLVAILLVPAGLNIHLSGDGVKFTPGRAAIALLLLPALFTFFRPSRHVIASDVFVFLTALWMVGSRIPFDGLNPSAVASALELFGGYFVSRAYFYGPRALTDYLRIFKVIMFLVITIAVLDPLLGQNVVQAAVAMIAQAPVNISNQERFGIIRAASTIEMAELYGTVCCVAGSIFLFMERANSAKCFWTGFALLGCILSLSSGPLLAFTIIIPIFIYDRLFGRYTGRWRLVTAILMLLLSIVLVVTDRPVSWLLSHLTLDASTGYFRMYVFDYMFQQMALSPLVGYGFNAVGDDGFLSTVTVDSVWLVCAIRYGIPMIGFFLCTNLASFMSLTSRRRSRGVDPFMANAATGFTQAIITFMLIGVTVHFWNATWMLWAVCIGIRGSIKEWQRYGGHGSYAWLTSPTPRASTIWPTANAPRAAR